jgi:hypothetical protein
VVGEVHQPATELAAVGIRLELVDGLRDAFEDVLGDILGLGVRQAGAAGEAVDEFLVEAVEFVPAGAVIPLSHAAQ